MKNIDTSKQNPWSLVECKPFWQTPKLKLWQLTNSNCDKPKKIKLWQNSKTQIVTVVIGTVVTVVVCDGCDSSDSSESSVKTNFVIFFLKIFLFFSKLWQLKISNCDKTQKLKIDHSKTQIVTKLKKSNFEKNQKRSNCDKSNSYSSDSSDSSSLQKLWQ